MVTDGLRRSLASSTALLAALAASACTVQHEGPASLESVLARGATGHGGRPGASPIRHVVYVIQENRSFNYLFDGFPGAVSQDYGYDEHGNKIRLHAQSIASHWDIDHSLKAFLTAYDKGKLDGWNEEYTCCGAGKNFAYARAPRKETATYWSMASQYVLADNLFQSNLDGSFVAHQYAIAAYANDEVDYPQRAWGCEDGPKNLVPTITAKRHVGHSVPVCEDYTTLGDELDQASLDWRYYSYPYDEVSGLWSAYNAIDHIFNGPDYANVITPSDRFLTDVANGSLAAVTWITPYASASDHAGLESRGGPDWVASVVDAVGQSPFWTSTAIFVVWDDWGGWYDPVAPPYRDEDGLGFRVPLIAISAYAKQGYVSHVQYETSSVLRFIEDDFGLTPLAASDARAADPATDFFDYTQPPRAFVPFAYASRRPQLRHVIRPEVPGD